MSGAAWLEGNPRKGKHSTRLRRAEGNYLGVVEISDARWCGSMAPGSADRFSGREPARCAGAALALRQLGLRDFPNAEDNALDGFRQMQPQTH